MELSKRLQAVVQLVSKGNVVADIGCDHAYSSIYMIQNHIAEHVIALDINEGPLQRAKENITKYHCEGKIETRLSDGAKELLQGEVQTLLMAGMGGALVRKILSDSKEMTAQVKELVLQPQSEIREVRKYLHTIGFEIIEEKMLLEDGKYYTVIKAVTNRLHNTTYQKEVYYRYGKQLLESKDLCLKEFLQKEKNKYETILKQLRNSDLKKNKARYITIKQDYEYCKEGLTYYEMQ